VLGISPDERDAGVIEEAALRQTRLIRRYQLAREAECARGLNAVALALCTLLDDARRKDYDREIHASAIRARQGRRHGTVPAAQSAAALNGLAGACDVKLIPRGWYARRASC
jgi:hypothetical protein